MCVEWIWQCKRESEHIFVARKEDEEENGKC